MSLIHKISIVVCFLLILACNKGFQPDFSNGQATADKNSKNWKGEGRGTINNQNLGLNMLFTVYNSAGIWRQQLSFRKIPHESGTYPLFATTGQEVDFISGCSFMTFSHDGDVIEDRYNVIESIDKSFITVHSYNEETRILRGAFEAMLELDTNRVHQNPDNPVMLHFENGEFEVRIEE